MVQITIRRKEMQTEQQRTRNIIISALYQHGITMKDHSDRFELVNSIYNEKEEEYRRLQNEFEPIYTIIKELLEIDEELSCTIDEGIEDHFILTFNYGRDKFVLAAYQLIINRGQTTKDLVTLARRKLKQKWGLGKITQSRSEKGSKTNRQTQVA